MKLWLQIALPTTAVVAAAIIVPGILQVRAQLRDEPEKLRAAASALAAATAVAAARPLAEGDPPALQFLVVNLVHRNPDLAYAVVVDREGTFVAHSDPDGERTAPHDAAALRAMESPVTLVHEIPRTAGAPAVLEVAEPVAVAGYRLGTVRIGVRQSALVDLARATVRRTLLAGGAFLAATLAVAVFVARTIAGPVAAIAALTGRVSSGGDLAVRAEERGADEVRSLARSLNDMIGRLDRSRDELVRSVRLATAGELVAGVAHEVNNPLATISASAEALLRRDAAGTPDAAMVREYLEIIREEAFRLRELTRDLLSFVRKDASAASPVQPNELVRSVAGLIRLRGPGRPGVELVIDLAPDADVPLVDGDAARLRQVIFNVTDNALDALPPGGGRVTWTSGSERGAAGAVALLRCRDDGAGMPPDVIARAFEPFFTTKEPGEGTGLGLSICYGIVRAHGGTIDIESPGAGRGTVVTLRLPERRP